MSAALSRARAGPQCAIKVTAAQPRPAAFVAPSFEIAHQRPCLRVCALDAPSTVETSSRVTTTHTPPSYISTSDKYAIIDVGGVQHLVEEGRWYTCNKLKASPGDVVSFGRVLVMKSEGEVFIGRPYVEGVTVEAEIVEELKGPKVIIYKMAPKKHTRKLVGHRQQLTKFVVTKISRS